MLRNLFIIVAILFLGAVIAHVVIQETPASLRASSSDEAVSVASQPKSLAYVRRIRVTAPDLYAAYHANEVAADEEFKGRPLTVKGYVTDIRKDFTDDAIIDLAVSQFLSGGAFERVNAEIAKQSMHSAARLAKGDIAVLNCTGGGMFVGVPVVKECSVIDEPKPKEKDEVSNVPPDHGPRLVSTVEPEVTEEAQTAKANGKVLVATLVNADGKPTNVRVLRSIGYGLDEKAIEAVSQYRFEPALKDGVAIASSINVEVAFEFR